MQRRRYVPLTACAFACLGMVTAAPAHAHSTPPTIVTSLDSISPPLPPGIVVGLTASVAEELFVTNTSATALEVLATGGEPFLRIARTGVEANTASPDWWTSNDPTGASPVPSSAKRGAAPVWMKVTSASTWAWFDHRLHPNAVTIPFALQQASRSALLSRWSVPVRVAGQTTNLTGAVSYEPVRGGLLVHVAQQPDGVTAQILQGRLPGVLLTAAGTGDVAIAGSDGMDFARITPRGAEVWTASPTWIANVQARGEPLALGPPRWLRVSANRSLTWLDPRLAAGQAVSAAVRNAGKPAVVSRWRIGMTVAGAPAVLAGTVDWVPATKSRASGAPVAAIVAIVVIVGVIVFALILSLVMLRRRRA